MSQPAYGKSYPFEAGSGQTSGNAEYRHMGAALGDGILNDVAGNAFAATASGSTRVVTVTLNELRIRGIHFEKIDASVDITLSTPSAGYTRADYIVARYDPSDKSIVIDKHEGAAVNVGTPALPSLLRNDGGTWELPLYSFTGGTGAASTLTKVDLRSWVAAYGLVATSSALSANDPVGTRRLALDTGHEWLRTLVSGTPTWANRTAPPPIAFPLAGSAGLLVPFNTPPTYRKSGGRAQLEGTIKRSGTPTAPPLVAAGGVTDVVLGTLPSGYRPSAQRLFVIPEIGGTGFARCYITTAGVVALTTDGKDTVGVALDGISFIADGN